jgi:nitrogen-specific signal transduction histidine kinase
VVDLLIVARGVLITAGFVLLGLAVWVDRHRDAPALRPFVLFVAVLGAVAVVDGAAAGNLTSLSIVWVGALLAIPCAFTWFVIEYYGLPYLSSPVRRIAFLAPAVVGVAGGTALVLSPSAAGSMAEGGPAAASLPSLLGFAAIAEQAGIYYASGVMLAGVGLLVRTVGNYEYLGSRLGFALSFVAAWPWVGYLVTPSLVGSFQRGGVISVIAGGYVLSVGAVGFILTRGGLFEAAPAAGTLGPKTVLSDLEDAVIVVDDDQRVVSLNAAAIDTFGVEPKSVSGQPLSACVGTDIDSLQGSETIELTTPEGTRQFDASVSPVRDKYDRKPGHAIVISDITQERVRSQRLAVLNRVLRHNLRNEMSNIMGRAEVIARSDNEYADSAETMLTSANNLMSLSERARQIEDMLSVQGDGIDNVALADLVGDVIAEYRGEYPDASLSVDIDESLTVTVDSRTLSGVLNNLVENALVHNDAPTSVVVISARRTDNGVRLSVSDNGPGLPEHERAVVEAGDESALEHGSGLGLWAVKWGVVGLGGKLRFNDNEPQGTIVTIELPETPTPGSSMAATIEAD